MNIKEIQNLIKFVSKSGVEEVKIEREDFKITIKTKKNITQQIVVDDIKNHKLYRITIEQNNVVRHKNKKPKFIFI